MKIQILSLAVLLLLAACDKKNKGAANGISDFTDSVTQELKEPVEEHEEVKPKVGDSEADIPGSAQFPLSGKVLERFKDHGGGDCWGNISIFEAGSIQVSVDTFQCSEYTSTNTYYLFNDAGTLMSLYQIHIQNDTDGLPEVTEKLINFKKETPELLMRKGFKQRGEPYKPEGEFRIAEDIDTSLDPDKWKNDLEKAKKGEFDDGY